MVYLVREKETILKFLRDNPQLSSYKAAEALCNLGIDISFRTIAKYRIFYNIDFHHKVSLSKQIKDDVEAGLITTSDQIIKKFGCCRSHANKALREARGYSIKRESKLEPVSGKEELPPVRVNTFAHAVQQLTANDASYKAVANG